MTKWPVQKPTHRTTHTHVEHQDATYIQKTLFVFRIFFIFFFIYNFLNDFSKNVEVLGLQRFDSMHRKSITDPPMRFSIFSVRFSIQSPYCSDPHFKHISVDAYQLFRTEQRIYAIAFKTRNFIG